MSHSEKTFVEELYSQKTDLYTDERIFVHNLFITEKVKTAISRHIQERRFKGVISSYTEDYGDSYDYIETENFHNYKFDKYIHRGIKYFTGTECYTNSKLDWSVVKSLIERELATKNLGLKECQITIKKEPYDRVTEIYQGLFGKPKCKTVPDYHYSIWIETEW